MQQVSFKVVLPAHVHAAVQGILQQAVQASSASLTIQQVSGAPTQALAASTPQAAELQPMPRGHAVTEYPGAFSQLPASGPVGEGIVDGSEIDDSDDASSMGAAEFGEGVAEGSEVAAHTEEPAAGPAGENASLQGSAVRMLQDAGLGQPGNRFAALSQIDDDSEMDEAGAAVTPEVVAATRPGHQGCMDEGDSSGDDWAADMRQELLGGGDGSVSGAIAAGFEGAGALPAEQRFNFSKFAPADMPTGGMSDVDRAAVQMQWTVQVQDQELRLGSMVQGGEAKEGELHISPELLQEDLNKLKVHLTTLLNLDRPDQDPDQFRCSSTRLPDHLRTHTVVLSKVRTGCATGNQDKDSMCCTHYLYKDMRWVNK